MLHHDDETYDAPLSLFDQNEYTTHETSSQNGGPWLQIDMKEPRFLSGVTFMFNPNKPEHKDTFTDISIFVSNKVYSSAQDSNSTIDLQVLF